MTRVVPQALPPLPRRKRITAACLARELPMPETFPYAALVTPDERTLLVGGSAVVHRIDLESGASESVRPLDGEYETFSQLELTPDGSRLVVTVWSGVVAVLAWPSLRKIAVHRVCNTRLHALAVMPDGRSAWVGGHDEKRSRIDLETGDVLAQQGGESMWMAEAVVAPDGSLLVTGDAGTNIRFCDADTGRERKVLRLGSPGRLSLAGAELLVPAIDTQIVDTSTYEVTTRCTGEHKLGAEDAVVTDGGAIVITGGNHDPTIALWNRDGRPLLTLKPFKKGAIRAVRVVGEQLLVIGLDAPAQLWHLPGLIAAAREG